MGFYDQPVSEAFSLSKHPLLRRKGVAVTYNIISTVVFVVMIMERFGMKLTGMVSMFDQIQLRISGGSYLYITSALLAAAVILLPLLGLFKAYEVVTQGKAEE
ncbi:MAG: hypothetical protein JXR97_09165 [Planctomycetes bacterium]|nr:hypothetical protein [Planctomycetota bacterium]